ncbi:hypothetical protein BH10ACT11_BH10ACT11_09530 [soil metagenome]
MRIGQGVAGRPAWTRVVVGLIAAGMIAALVALAPSAGAVPLDRGHGHKQKHRFHYKFDRHLSDSRTSKLRHEGDNGAKGKLKIVDVFTAPSKQTFRSHPGGKRKRVYRVRGRVSISTFNDYKILYVQCHEKTQGGAYALSTPHSQRLFFPRPSTSLTPHRTEGSVSAELGHFSVKLPFPGITYYQHSNTDPDVTWSVRSSNRHVWRWVPTVDSSNESFGFAGHFAGPADGMKTALGCKAVANHNTAGAAARTGLKTEIKAN